MSEAAKTRARRGRGEGGVRKRADGRWEATIEVAHRDGKRRRKTLYARTRADAVQLLHQEQQRIASGLAPTDGRQTTGQFLRWWQRTVLPGTVSVGSEETYGRYLKCYVIPAVGHIRLATLTPARVTEMMRAMEAGQLSSGRPLSAQTQNAARKLLARALRRAEQEGLIARNPAALADGPRIPRREGRSLTKEQAHALLVAVETDRLGTAYALQLALGLRRGEVLGLRWNDVDLDAEPPLVRVRQQLQRRPRSGLVLHDLKTPQSRRNLVLPAPATAALRSWRSAQAAERLASGGEWRNADGLVFTTPLGTPVDPANFRHRLSSLAESAGLGHWTTHELRHSAGSLLFAAGIPIKLISEMLGHLSERVTSDVYIHTQEAARNQVASTMADALWGGAEQKPFGGQIGGQQNRGSAAAEA
jgi:integrase